MNQVVVDREFKQMHLTVTASDVTEGKSQFMQLFATQSNDGSALVKAFPAWFLKQEDSRESRLVAVTRVLEAKHPITLAQMHDYYTKNVGSLCRVRVRRRAHPREDAGRSAGDRDAACGRRRLRHPREAEVDRHGVGEERRRPRLPVER